LPDILRYGVLTGVRITAEREFVSVDEEALSRWYSVVHVVEPEELQDVSCSPDKIMENRACRGHVSTPRAASATSPTLRFGSEAKILQLA